MLLNRIGCKRKKKGFTLIELIISISIDLVIVSICFNIITVNYKNFKVLTTYSRANSSLDDAILNINRYLKAKMIEDIEIKDDIDIITIKYREKHSKESIKVKEIFLNKYNKIAIRTLVQNANEVTDRDSPMLINVDTFDIIKKGRVYYLKIRVLNGDERIICL